MLSAEEKRNISIQSDIFLTKLEVCGLTCEKRQAISKILHDAVHEAGASIDSYITAMRAGTKGVVIHREYVEHCHKLIEEFMQSIKRDNA